jgi:hypothetical protein
MNGFQGGAISLYNFRIVDKKEILCIVSHTSIYCSNDRVGTVYRKHQRTLQLV